MNNIFHFLQIRSYRPFFFSPEWIQEKAGRIFLIRQLLDERFKDDTDKKSEFMLVLLPSVDINKRGNVCVKQH